MKTSINEDNHELDLEAVRASGGIPQETDKELEAWNALSDEDKVIRIDKTKGLFKQLFEAFPECFTL